MILDINQNLESFEFNLILLFSLTILTLVVYWLIQRFIFRRLIIGKKIPLDILNVLKVLLKISSVLFIFYCAIQLFNIPIEQIFGLSALLGAIVSFSSTQAVTNFIAGLYLLFIHPFGVDDFIAFGDEVRGQVIEISLNYTKIRTVDNIFHSIPNNNFLSAIIVVFKQKVKRRIGITKSPEFHNRLKLWRELVPLFLEEDVVRYSFTWGIPIGNLKKIKQQIQEVCDIYAGVFGYKPEFFLYTIDRRLQFRFIIITHSSELLLRNIREFRNDISARFY